MKNVLLTAAADCCSLLSVASFGLLPTRPCSLRTVAHKTMILTDCCPQDHALYRLLPTRPYFLRTVADCFLHHFEKCAWMASYSLQFLLCLVRENLLRGNVFAYLILSVLSSGNNIPHVTHTLTLTHSLSVRLSLSDNQILSHHRPLLWY